MDIKWVTIIGLVGAFCTTISFLPQVIKTLKTRKTRDISLLMYVVLAVGLLLWFVYGLIIKDLPIIVANAITFSLVIIVLILKAKHG